MGFYGESTFLLQWDCGCDCDCCCCCDLTTSPLPNDFFYFERWTMLLKKKKKLLLWSLNLLLPRLVILQQWLRLIYCCGCDCVDSVVADDAFWMMGSCSLKLVVKLV